MTMNLMTHTMILRKKRHRGHLAGLMMMSQRRLRLQALVTLSPRNWRGQVPKVGQSHGMSLALKNR